MFRALWIKHWVQLRTLRWVGFGLCIVLPFFLWTGAAAAKRGWFAFSVGDYSLVTIFGEALPPFSILLLVFLAVMFAAQIFAGDRADGTERFLLERPVPRTRVWQARLLAALASALWVWLANAVYILALVSIVDDGSLAGGVSAILIKLAAGLALAVLGVLGGMAAGEIVRTPMQGVLIGLVLAALPVGTVMFLSSAFQFVRVAGTVHLAYFVAPILPAALILAAYRAGCLGEPSGRGRIQRGLVVLVVAAVLTPALFASVAPFVLRAAVTGAWPQGIAAAADRAIVVGGSYRQNDGGFMIDTAAATRTRFLPPPVRASGYKADGSLAAVIDQSGVLGSVGPVKLDFFDSSGRLVNSLTLEAEHSFAYGLQWAGDLVLVLESVGETDGRIQLVDPRRGVLGTITVEVASRGQSWSLHGPTTDGSVYVHRLVGQDPRRYELARLDLEALTIEEPTLIEHGDIPTFARKQLSPSGRYWARVLFDGGKYASSVTDLRSGERVDYPTSLIVGWLTEDRLLRVDPIEDAVRVIVQQGIGDVLQEREFPRGVGVGVSPDLRRFVVSQRTSTEAYFGAPFYWMANGTGVNRLLISDGLEWTALDSLIDGLQDGTILNWGGPNTLLASSDNATAVADAKPGAKWKSVIGRWE